MKLTLVLFLGLCTFCAEICHADSDALADIPEESQDANPSELELSVSPETEEENQPEVSAEPIEKSQLIGSVQPDGPTQQTQVDPAQLEAEQDLIKAGGLIDDLSWQIDTLAEYLLEVPEHYLPKASSWKAALFVTEEQLADAVGYYMANKLGLSEFLRNKMQFDMTFQYDLVEVCEKVEQQLGKPAERFEKGGMVTADGESRAWRLLAKAQICAKLVEKKDELYDLVYSAESYPPLA